MLNLSGLSGFVKGRSFLETNWTGFVAQSCWSRKIELESPLLSSKNEAGGGVVGKVSTFRNICENN